MMAEDIPTAANTLKSHNLAASKVPQSAADLSFAGSDCAVPACWSRLLAGRCSWRGWETGDGGKTAPQPGGSREVEGKSRLLLSFLFQLQKTWKKQLKAMTYIKCIADILFPVTQRELPQMRESEEKEKKKVSHGSWNDEQWLNLQNKPPHRPVLSQPVDGVLDFLLGFWQLALSRCYPAVT